MYQSGKDQLMQARKESSNKRLITEDIDQMIRNKMIMQGLTPISIDTEIPEIQKNEIIEALKRITIQPTKFYKYLFDTNQLDLFSMGLEEFVRKYLKYRKNISYDSLVSAWEKFKLDPTTRLEGLAELQQRESRKKIYDNELLERNKLARTEMYEREGIKRGNLTKERSDAIKYFDTVKRNLMKQLEKEQNLTKQDEMWQDIANIEKYKKQVLNPNINLDVLMEEYKKFPKKSTPQLSEEKKQDLNKRKKEIDNAKSMISFMNESKSKYIERIPDEIQKMKEQGQSQQIIDLTIKNTLESFDQGIENAEKRLDKAMKGSGISRVSRVPRLRVKQQQVYYPYGKVWHYQ